MQNALTIIPVVMLVASSLVTIAGIIIMLRHRTETIQRDLDKEELEVNAKFERLEKTINDQLSNTARILDEATKQLTQALTMIKIHATEQAVINKVSSDTISSLSKSLTEQQRQLADHSTEIALLKHHAASWNERP